MSLTPKQEKFCQCIVSGMSGKDSYIASYDTKASDQVIRNEANKLLMRDDITERIKELRVPLHNHAINTALSEREQKKKLINERIQACIAKEDDTSIARYIDILNKMDQEYINIHKDISEEKTTIEQLDNVTLLKLAE